MDMVAKLSNTYVSRNEDEELEEGEEEDEEEHMTDEPEPTQEPYIPDEIPPREDSLSPGAEAPPLANIPTSNPQLPPSYFSDPTSFSDPLVDLTAHLTTTRLTTPPHSPSSTTFPHSIDGPSSSSSEPPSQTRHHRRESIFAPPTPEETCLEFSPHLRDPAHLGQVCQYIHGEPRSPHPPAVQLRRRAIVRELIDSATGDGGFEVLGGFIRRDRTASVAGGAGAGGVSGWRGKGRRGDGGGVDAMIGGLERGDGGAGVRIDSLTPSFGGNYGKAREGGNGDVMSGEEEEEEGARKRTLSFMQGSDDGQPRRHSPSKRRLGEDRGARAGGDDARRGNEIRQTRAASEGSIQGWRQMMPAWLAAAKPTLEDLVE